MQNRFLEFGTEGRSDGPVGKWLQTRMMWRNYWQVSVGAGEGNRTLVSIHLLQSG